MSGLFTKLFLSKNTCLNQLTVIYHSNLTPVKFGSHNANGHRTGLFTKNVCSK